MKISKSTNDQLMAMAAFRYCLTRSSYIVGSCIEWTRAHWDQFDTNTQHVMLRDTVEHLIDQRTGDPNIDRPEWLALAHWMYESMDPVARSNIERALEWKGAAESLEILMGKIKERK